MVRRQAEFAAAPAMDDLLAHSSAWDIPASGGGLLKTESSGSPENTQKLLDGYVLGHEIQQLVQYPEFPCWRTANWSFFGFWRAFWVSCLFKSQKSRR